MKDQSVAMEFLTRLNLKTGEVFAKAARVDVRLWALAIFLSALDTGFPSLFLV